MYRSSSDTPYPANLPLTQHGILTTHGMLALLQPGALDASTIVGHRVRWAYSSTRRGSHEAKRVADELKRLHLRMGAREVIVFHAAWLKDDAE